MTKYYRNQAKSEKGTLKSQEYNSLKNLVTEMKNNTSISDFNSFYISYDIPNISKEFDLLKIDDEKVLNIELKAISVDEDRIKKQLLRNRYYLRFLGKKVYSYTFISSTKMLYVLDGDDLVETSMEELVRTNNRFGDCYNGNLDELFEPSKFLLGPFKYPTRFLENEYFLTQAQESIFTKIKKEISKDVKSFIILNGRSGTGKSLLLYHTARFYKEEGKKVCVVHVANLHEGHYKLKKELGIDIFPIKSMNYIDLENYDVVLFDEAHRLYDSQAEELLKIYEKNNMHILLFLDPRQVMSYSEESAKIDEYFNDKIKEIKNIKLTEGVRTNKKVISFVEKLMDLSKQRRNIDYRFIDLIYISEIEDVNNLLEIYEKNYTILNYTESIFNRAKWELLRSDFNSHEVIGLEYDNVLVIMGPEIYYENKKLTALNHPCPNYKYEKLLYQMLTRATNKICIIVYDNEDLYKELNNIFK